MSAGKRWAVERPPKRRTAARRVRSSSGGIQEGSQGSVPKGEFYSTAPAETTAQLSAAVAFLVAEPHPPRPIIPNLRRTFGLSAVEAVHAVQAAQRQRMAGAAL